MPADRTGVNRSETESLAQGASSRSGLTLDTAWRKIAFIGEAVAERGSNLQGKTLKVGDRWSVISPVREGF